MNAAHAQGTGFPVSFEFFPPKTPEGADKLRVARQQLYALHPDFCSVTYGAGGSTQEGTFGTVREILSEGVGAASHFSCIGATRQSVREQLAKLKAMGVKRLVALRGDLPSGYGAGGEFQYASDLVAFIRADDRAVANPAMHLPGHAAGGAGAGHAAVGAQRQHSDGVVVLAVAGDATPFRVDLRCVLRCLEPFAPGFLGLRRAQAARLEAFGHRELARAIADQQYVRGLLHHPARDRDRMIDVLQRGHRAATAIAAHDAGVQGHEPVPIRIPAAADGGIALPGLAPARTGLHRIQCVAASAQYPPRRRVRGHAEIPGGDDLGTGGCRIGTRPGQHRRARGHQGGLQEATAGCHAMPRQEGWWAACHAAAPMIPNWPCSTV